MKITLPPSIEGGPQPYPWLMPRSMDWLRASHSCVSFVTVGGRRVSPPLATVARRRIACREGCEGSPRGLGGGYR
ncbi:hypothetical protein JTE90_022103 [Oedothorax gibbosus]|uniref:Uncharacterized protein n=1 Tax=Oedothorax gibbosus TaxID=931172 RepID=A0AAV6U2Q7_9ARAC|nr:hypothetical protein JTE90_022103 [Oedothorax gibbosus]